MVKMKLLQSNAECERVLSRKISMEVRWAMLWLIPFCIVKSMLAAWSYFILEVIRTLEEMELNQITSKGKARVKRVEEPTPSQRSFPERHFPF